MDTITSIKVHKHKSKMRFIRHISLLGYKYHTTTVKAHVFCYNTDILSVVIFIEFIHIFLFCI